MKFQLDSHLPDLLESVRGSSLASLVPQGMLGLSYDALRDPSVTAAQLSVLDACHADKVLREMTSRHEAILRHVEPGRAMIDRGLLDAVSPYREMGRLVGGIHAEWIDNKPLAGLLEEHHRCIAAIADHVQVGSRFERDLSALAGIVNASEFHQKLDGELQSLARLAEWRSPLDDLSASLASTLGFSMLDQDILNVLDASHHVGQTSQWLSDFDVLVQAIVERRGGDVDDDVASAPSHDAPEAPPAEDRRLAEKLAVPAYRVRALFTDLAQASDVAAFGCNASLLELIEGRKGFMRISRFQR